MQEVMFLWILALIWIIFASVQDLRKREVANWLNFSLIIFALGFRLFSGLFSGEGFQILWQGIIGLGIFFILGNVLYYGKMFAGGDAKLMIALGAVLPISSIFSINLKIFFSFFLLFLFAGAIYGLIATVRISLTNFKEFKKDFIKRLKKNKIKVYCIMLIGLTFVIGGFFETIFFSIGALIFAFPYLYLYARSVDERCMVKKVKVGDLTEGDWLYEKIKVGRGFIEPNWEGLSKKDIVLIKKSYKEIKIKQGIPFIPVFLIAFLALMYLWFSGLWNVFW